MAAPIAQQARLLTARDLANLPEDGMLYELIRGELRRMPPPGWKHGTFTDRLSSRLSVFVDDHNLGVCTAAETGFKLESDPDTVMAPDWAFVAGERIPAQDP